jgi:hypothetical protein
MMELVQQGMLYDQMRAPAPTSGEDWRYWMESLSPENDTEEWQRLSLEQKVNRMSEKYSSMKTALQPFLDFVREHPGGLSAVGE